MKKDNYSIVLKAYRERHNLKQEELAEILGVNNYTLRAWEQGIKPKYQIWRKIKQILND